VTINFFPEIQSKLSILARYKGPKEGGIPDDVSVKMTKDYNRVFTSLGDILKQVKGKGKGFISTKEGKEINKRRERSQREDN